MRSLFFPVLLIVLGACSSNSSTKENAETSDLRSQKYKIDSLISDSSLQVYVKVKGQKDLVAFKKGPYPKNLETSYNVLKDKDGKVIYIAELPYNAISDWFIAYKSYFDKDGKLFVFQRQNNFLGSKCTYGAALESLTKYYKDFKAVDSVYTLKDSNKKDLDKATCKFPYNFPYKISKTLNEYKQERGISAF